MSFARACGKIGKVLSKDKRRLEKMPFGSISLTKFTLILMLPQMNQEAMAALQLSVFQTPYF